MALLNKVYGNQNTTKLLNYLKSSPDQYPCLTKEQERAMIEKFKNDRTTLNKLLFMHNIRMVFSMASTYVSKYKDFDTVVQDGMVGLGEAAKRFKLEKNIKFCTYAMIWVKKFMSGYYYTRQYQKIDSMTVSLSTPTKVSQEDGAQTLESVIQSYIDPAAEQVKNSIDYQLSSDECTRICEDLYDQLKNDTSLSATEKAVFTDLFIEREKARDIAEKYKLDSDQVSVIRRKILDKFKDILVNDYEITSYFDIAAV